MSQPPPVEELALYMFEGCPYCDRVRAAMKQMGVTMELRDIHKEPRWRDELLQVIGRKTVPVLRVGGESAQWIPESAEIVTWLHGRYGDGRLPFMNPALERILLLAALFALMKGLGDVGDGSWAGLGVGLLLLGLSEAWRGWRWAKRSAWATGGGLALAGIIALVAT